MIYYPTPPGFTIDLEEGHWNPPTPLGDSGWLCHTQSNPAEGGGVGVKDAGGAVVKAWVVPAGGVIYISPSGVVCLPDGSA